MKKLFLIPLIFFTACAGSNDSEEKTTLNKPSEWQGIWKAEWETPPESYPGIEDMEFYMDGNFEFTPDSLIVTANGYPDCIFSVDTLVHAQSWHVANDTLFLLNEPNTASISYKVTSKTTDRITLQLMDDIIVTLSK